MDDKVRTVDQFGNILIEPNNRDWSKMHEAIINYVFTLGKSKKYDYYSELQEVTINIIKETEKAVQWKITTTADEKDLRDGENIDDFSRKIWVPKSIINETEDGIELPRWFVKKNDLGDYCVEKKIITEKYHGR